MPTVWRIDHERAQGDRGSRDREHLPEVQPGDRAGLLSLAPDRPVNLSCGPPSEPVDLDADAQRFAALVGLIVLGLLAIVFAREGDRVGLSPLAAGVSGLAAAAVLWTAVLWIVISRNRGSS